MPSQTLEILLKMRDQASGQLGQVNSRLGKFRQNLSQLKGPALAVGTAIAGSVASFGQLGDQLQKMSIRTGFSVQALSELRFAADQSGASLDALGPSIRRMQRVIAQGDEASTKWKASLDAIGVSLENLQGLSPEEQFLAIADGFSQIEDAALKTEVAFNLFGDQGVKLIPLLEQGSAGIGEFAAQARELGIVMDQEMADKAARMNDAMNSAKQVIVGLAAELGSAVAPALSTIAEAFASLPGPVRTATAAIVALGIAVAATPIGIIPAAIGAAIVVIIAFRKEIASAVTAVLDFAKGIEPVRLVIDLIVERVKLFASTVVEAVKLVVAVVKGDWSAAWDSAKQIVENVANSIISSFEFAVNMVIASFDLILDAFAAVLDGIAAGVSKLPLIGDKMAGPIRKAADAIRGALDGVRADFGRLGDDLSAAEKQMTRNVEAAETQMRGLAQTGGVMTDELRKAIGVAGETGDALAAMGNDAQAGAAVAIDAITGISASALAMKVVLGEISLSEAMGLAKAAGMIQRVASAVEGVLQPAFEGTASAARETGGAVDDLGGSVSSAGGAAQAAAGGFEFLSRTINQVKADTQALMNTIVGNFQSALSAMADAVQRAALLPMIDKFIAAFGERLPASVQTTIASMIEAGASAGQLRSAMGDVATIAGVTQEEMAALGISFDGIQGSAASAGAAAASSAGGFAAAGSAAQTATGQVQGLTQAYYDYAAAVAQATANTAIATGQQAAAAGQSTATIMVNKGGSLTTVDPMAFRGLTPVQAQQKLAGMGFSQQEIQQIMPQIQPFLLNTQTGRLFSGAPQQIGTQFFRGGVATINEAGPEQVILPKGTRVIPASRTPHAGQQIINQIALHIMQPLGSPEEISRAVMDALIQLQKRGRIQTVTAG